MSVKAKTRPKSPATSMIGWMSGIVIWNRCRKKPAPSTWAASRMSWGSEVSRARGREEPEPRQGPVDPAVGGVEDPEPADRPQRDRRHPGQQDQQAPEPLAPEVAREREREHRAQHHHEDLGHDREDERVLQRGLELRRLDDAREVLEPHEAERAAAHGDVADAVVEREQERHAQDEDDVEYGRPDHEGPEPLVPVQQEAQPAPPAHRGRAAVRRPGGLSEDLTSRAP